MARGFALLPTASVLLLCLCLLPLLISPVHAQTPAGALCSVHIEGSNGSMSKSAVVCTQGSIDAASDDPNALAQFQAGSSGVKWTDTLCDMEAETCLLAICGVAGGGVLELQLTVSGYTDATNYLWGVVCIAGNTQASIKGAILTRNDVAGLAVNGSAEVSISNSSFSRIARETWDGAALVAGGRATVRVAGTVFEGNHVDNGYNEDTGRHAGALLVENDAHVLLQNCSFSSNWAEFGDGGAIVVSERAKLTASNVIFYDNVATRGGALFAGEQAEVFIDNSTFEANWATFGGGVYAAGSSNVTISRSVLAYNYVKDYWAAASGGACCVNHSATLSLINTTVRNNDAQMKGGGVSVESKSAVLRLGPNTSVIGNSARQAGGLFLQSLLDNMTYAAAITQRNKAVVSDDIGVNLTRLVMLSERNVSSFVPRLSENKGLLPVLLRLSGKDDLPGAAAIQAVLHGRPVARNTSDPVTGEALLNINLQQPPGTYALSFEVMAMGEALHTNMSVTVAPCGPGEVNITLENACNICPKGSFSLDPQAQECTRCPPNAVCEEGFIIPSKGFWSSSVRSNQVHRCLYPPACEQTLNASQLQQTSSASTNSDFMAGQCAEGHEGNLCSQCIPGWGQRFSATVGACKPCADAAQIVVLYILAAFASMSFIKLLCFLNAQADAGLAAARSSALLSTGTSASALAPAGSPQVSSSRLDRNQTPSAGSRQVSSTRLDSTQTPGSKPPSAIPLGPAANSSAFAQPAVQAVQAGQAPVQSRACLGDLLKPFVIYLQWMLMVASVNIEWPTVFTAPLSAVRWLFASSGTATGLDCLLARDIRLLPLALQKVLLGLVLPCALLVILLTFDSLMLSCRTRRRGGRRGGWRLPVLSRQPAARGGRGVLARTVIVLIFFFLPTLLRTAYSLFVCVQLDSELPAELRVRKTFYQFDAVGRFWVLDTNQHCFAGYHAAWALGLGIPLLLLLCGVVPFGIIGYLWLRRKHLDETYYLQHYGFLFSSYRPHMYLWEGVVALQTCVVVAINAFGATLPAVYQCALFTAAFGVALVMLSVFRPFEQRAPNLVGIQSLGCLILTAQAALVTAALTASSVADGASSSGTAAATAVCAVVIVVNVVFVLSFAWQLVHVVDWAAVGSATRKVTTKFSSQCSGCVGPYSVGSCLAGKSAES